MGCRVVGKLCKRTDEKIPIPIDITEFLEVRWRARGIYHVGNTVRPSPELQRGLEFRCMVGGQAGSIEPFSCELSGLPIADGDVIIDGALTWEAQAVSNSSLSKTIDTVTWSGPTGMTFSGENIVNTDGQQMFGCYAAGTIAIGTHRVSALVVFSDTHSEEFAVDVKVPA